MSRPHFFFCCFLFLAALSLVPANANASADSPAFEDAYVTANGLRLHVVSAGKGPLILFLHGFPEFWYEWEDQLQEFSRDHLAVAPDLPGFLQCETRTSSCDIRISEST